MVKYFPLIYFFKKWLSLSILIKYKTVINVVSTFTVCWISVLLVIFFLFYFILFFLEFWENNNNNKVN